jgi:hypothetical protein
MLFIRNVVCRADRVIDKCSDTVSGHRLQMSSAQFATCSKWPTFLSGTYLETPSTVAKTDQRSGCSRPLMRRCRSAAATRPPPPVVRHSSAATASRPRPWRRSPVFATTAPPYRRREGCPGGVDGRSQGGAEFLRGGQHGEMLALGGDDHPGDCSTGRSVWL